MSPTDHAKNTEYASVKNVHSPSGMNFFDAHANANLMDCPFCKYGTIEWGKCIDCGKVLPHKCTHFDGKFHQSIS